MSLNKWMRPTGDSRWHSVVEVQPGGSVSTRCFGRWPTSMEREEHDAPPIPDRCRACLAALVKAEPTGMSGVVLFDLSERDS